MYDFADVFWNLLDAQCNIFRHTTSLERSFDKRKYLSIIRQRLRCLSSSQFRGQTSFCRARIFLLAWFTRRRACNLGLAPVRVEHASPREAPRTCPRVYAWRCARCGEQREEKTGEGERRRRGSEKTRYLKLHGSVYYLLSAISASTEKVHPTDDRRMICAPDALESARSINEEARTHAARAIGRGSQFEFLSRSCRPIVRYSAFCFFFSPFSLGYRVETRKNTLRATTAER